MFEFLNYTENSLSETHLHPSQMQDFQTDSTFKSEKYSHMNTLLIFSSVSYMFLNDY